MCAGTVVIYVVSGPVPIVRGLYGCHTLFFAHHPLTLTQFLAFSAAAFSLHNIHEFDRVC